MVLGPVALCGWVRGSRVVRGVFDASVCLIRPKGRVPGMLQCSGVLRRVLSELDPDWRVWLAWFGGGRASVWCRAVLVVPVHGGS